MARANNEKIDSKQIGQPRDFSAVRRRPHVSRQRGRLRSNVGHSSTRRFSPQLPRRSEPTAHGQYTLHTMAAAQRVQQRCGPANQTVHGFPDARGESSHAARGAAARARPWVKRARQRSAPVGGTSASSSRPTGAFVISSPPVRAGPKRSRTEVGLKLLRQRFMARPRPQPPSPKRSVRSSRVQERSMRGMRPTAIENSSLHPSADVPARCRCWPALRCGCLVRGPEIREYSRQIGSHLFNRANCVSI